jgi:predicted ATPase/class 3 adenylate cyclase
MTVLPTGTVTMAFSDIEGSTLLLTRLGPAYADALTAQRQLLRAAWSAHSGTEIGTEGDSFFVVFETAPHAVAAVTRAQRELAGHPWPDGVRMQVRMGVHTGTPAVLDGSYVGMDVHRAARIAAAAHGGQILISGATAHLVGSDLPAGVRLRGLGSHRLKDIPQAEALFQLEIDELRADFPPVRTLGAASSLPVPATPLVGRDGELAELVALVRTGDVRLVTLTGPGGSGKTRLAIALAQRLVGAFGDGVFFVPLAAATTPDVMWTTLAEALDLRPGERTRDHVVLHLAARTALVVLDNLEQLEGAHSMVEELLVRSPRSAFVATSRRPLHLAAEHEHPVPPMSSLDAVSSGAVQLFAEQARRVRPGFTVTADNVAEVAAVCRKLDGLPLAIEVAASRIKLLSPRAMLARLDGALDMASSRPGPERHRTLRATIAWSYNLLTAPSQVLFRRLGVFAGGADLSAIDAVAGSDVGGDAEQLDTLADLVDASLLTVTEDPEGEPRVAMLETVRRFALDNATAAGELAALRKRHAHHYLQVARALAAKLDGETYLDARSRFEQDHGNFREALGWLLIDTADSEPAADVRLGLTLCTALSGFWTAGGYFSEGRRWLTQAIERADGKDSAELAAGLSALAINLRHSDAPVARAEVYAGASVDMWRRLEDTSGLARALTILAFTRANRGQTEAARALYLEAIQTARESGETVQLQTALGDFAILKDYEHDHATALALHGEALELAREAGSPFAVLKYQHNMAWTLRTMGRLDEARQQLQELVPHALTYSEPMSLITLAEDYAAVVAELGSYQCAARLLGSADTLRMRLSAAREPMQTEAISDAIERARNGLSPQEWEVAYGAGRELPVEEALLEACTAQS